MMELASRHVAIVANLSPSFSVVWDSWKALEVAELFERATVPYLHPLTTRLADGLGHQFAVVAVTAFPLGALTAFRR
jgi:hypothetical protein